MNCHLKNDTKCGGYKKGDLAVSLFGHDMGKLVVVVKTEGGFVYVADGKLRKADKPKRKNPKHIGHTNLHTDILESVPGYAVDANIRREIKRLADML